MMPIIWDSIDYLYLHTIYQEWFQPYSDIIGISSKDNWYINNKLCLGIYPSQSPGAEISYLLHEMGHLIEIDDDRCNLPDWGLKLGKWNDSLGCRESLLTNAAIEREIRVFAIEIILGRYYGLESKHYTPAYCAKVCDFIDGMIHYYPKNWREMKYDEYRKAGYKNIARKISREISKWNIEKIKAEWIRKIQILRNRPPIYQEYYVNNYYREINFKEFWS